ncbi:MAG: SRPBCC family protein [Actinomycetota bacterium]|nr:SRPBCC family protein [Actinomycetota bacterium]
MSTQSVAPSVHAATVVQAPIERAFEVFTAGIGSWWPKENHILDAELAEMVVEPGVGGRIYDVGVDGSESHWARVLAYEPPRRFVFSWDITTRWTLETDPARCSEIEVRFIVESPQRTRVELEHRGIERHGEGWESMHGAVGSPHGWTGGLEAFAQRLAS